MKQGLVHLYTGDGKGKTTAALGLILRASGCGLQTVLVQFLKGRDTGELHVLKHLSHVTVFRYTDPCSFYQDACEEERINMKQWNDENLKQANDMVKEGKCDLLVLDEICAAYNTGAVDKELADNIILEKPCGLELVLTGRDAPDHFIEAADYVTECVKRKHPYDKGIDCREGIEY